MLSTGDRERIRDAFTTARALVITAGAGMGVDSGLPDFRGPEGFWNAYPPYRRLNLSFEEAANPDHFDRDPLFGWGFYGHRTNLYRSTVPHEGFAALRRLIDRFELDCFVVTSNVDGQFQKAGFTEDQILEVHGSIHYLQCCTPCSLQIWKNCEVVSVDPTTMRAKCTPRCPRCGGVSRPNILMFGDFTWLSDRTEQQRRRFSSFCDQHRASPLLIVELGAGTAIPTIRYQSESLAGRHRGLMIRINPREPWVPADAISIPCSARDGAKIIEECCG